MSEKLLLLGDQAIAQGAIDAGITGVYAYPGTPSTEITEYIQSHAPKIHSRWCTNEKTAMEAALGVSYVGRRAIVCFKHVGLNVAADAFINSAMTGTNGGLLVVSADDPSMHSSQNEQDSRWYAKFAMIPLLEPSNQQEAYDMVAYGLELSERLGLPVMLRITTRLAHSRAVVARGGSLEPEPIHFPKNPADWVLLPVNARRRYEALVGVQPEMGRLARLSGWNNYRNGNDKRMGILACGIAYNYLMEWAPELGDFPVLKIGQYPLPDDIIRQMAWNCEELLIMEEGQPILEEVIRGILPSPCTVSGRLNGKLPRTGELNPNAVRHALGLPPLPEGEACPIVVPRPPSLCAGCGHRDVYEALNRVVAAKADCKVFSDIGCYTLGALPPFRAIDTCVDMGASITMAKGATDAGLKYAVAVIGDSTFTHSGMTGLLDAVNSNAPVTIIISDNLTTAMTGGQDSSGTGKLEAICLALGVEAEHLHVVTPLPKNMDAITGLIDREVEYRGVSVIIPRRECIQTLKRKHKK